jgi:hypothetical protein
MPRPDVDEVVSQGHGRLFLQFCGPSPNNELQYAGYNTQYLALEGVTRPVRGGLTPIRVPDPVTPKMTKIVGYSVEAPDFITATLRATERHGAIPFQWGPNDQPFNIYLPRGKCERLDDFDGWTDFVEIYSYNLVTEGDFGTRTPTWDGDDMIDDSMSLTVMAAYMAGSISFGYVASDETNREIIDVTFGTSRGCSECGVNDPYGTNRWYSVARPSGAGSPGLLAEVIYQVAPGDIRQKTIENFGASEEPLSIGIVGSYLIVLGDGAYFYAAINKKTGVVGSFTKVTTGFDSSHKPLRMFVTNPREIYFAAEDGWVYRSTSVPTGVSAILRGDVTSSHLRDIFAEGEVVLAVGDSGAIVISLNRGTTWAAAPTSPSIWGFRTCHAFDENSWWVGTGAGDGRLFFTDNGGETWTETVLPASDEVNHVLFPTDEVGYVLFRTDSAARIYATINGGQTWTDSTDTVQRRLVNLPSFVKGNRLAAPFNPGTIEANNLLVAGALTGASDSDGVVVLGSSPLR